MDDLRRGHRPGIAASQLDGHQRGWQPRARAAFRRGVRQVCTRRQVYVRARPRPGQPQPARPETGLQQSGLSKDESLRVAESFAGYSIRYGLDPLAPRDGSAAVRDTAGELLLDAVLVRKKFQAWVKVGTGRPQYVQCTGKGDHRGRWPTSAVHVRPRAAGATAEGTTRGRRPAPPQRAGLAPARTIPHLQWC
jgi:hypothetical protein